MLSVLHSQYHAWWCSGDFRSQGNNVQGIDLQSQNIPYPVSEELKLPIAYAAALTNMSKYTTWIF